MELLPILFCCGLSAGVIGKIKGASFFLWFLVGLCLPLLGTIAAVMARNEREVPRRGCDECGATVPIHDQVCRRCGADLTFPDPVRDREPEPVRQQRLFEG